MKQPFEKGLIVTYKGGNDWYRVRLDEGMTCLIQHINSGKIKDVATARLRPIPSVKVNIIDTNAPPHIQLVSGENPFIKDFYNYLDSMMKPHR